MKKWILRASLLLALIASPFLAYQAIYFHNTGDPSKNPLLKKKEYVCRIWITGVLHNTTTVYTVFKESDGWWVYTKFRSEPAWIFKGHFDFLINRKKWLFGDHPDFILPPPPVFDSMDEMKSRLEIDFRHPMTTPEFQEEIFSENIGERDYPPGVTDGYSYKYYFKIEDKEVTFAIYNVFDQPIIREVEKLNDFTYSIQQFFYGTGDQAIPSITRQVRGMPSGSASQHPSL